MLSALDFIVLTLAAGAVVDVWFNGSLFAGMRAYMEVRADDDSPPHVYWTFPSAPYYRGDFWLCIADFIVPRWLAKLLTCHYCTSYHAPWIILLFLIFLPPYCVAAVAAEVLRIPFYALAAARAGNLINALLPKNAQYDRATLDNDVQSPAPIPGDTLNNEFQPPVVSPRTGPTSEPIRERSADSRP